MRVTHSPKYAGIMGIMGMYSNRLSPSCFGELEKVLQLPGIYIDTADVYSQVKMISDILSRSSVKVQEKIGANLSDRNTLDECIYSAQELINKYEKVNLVAVLLHRPNSGNLSRDTKLLEFIKKTYDHVSVGICSNDLSLVKKFHQNLDIELVQTAMNLLDYERNRQLVEFCHSVGIKLQARTVLAAGLLCKDNILNEDRRFIDPIRCRFHLNCKNRKVYDVRRKRAKMIYKFYAKKLDEIKIPFENFCYAATAALLPENSEVIVGGSTAEMLRKNIKSASIDHSIVEMVREQVASWEAPYI